MWNVASLLSETQLVDIVNQTSHGGHFEAHTPPYAMLFIFGACILGGKTLF